MYWWHWLNWPPSFRVGSVGPAIVGGLLGAFAVLIGVVLTEVLKRASDRRSELEALVHELSLVAGTLSLACQERTHKQISERQVLRAHRSHCGYKPSHDGRWKNRTEIPILKPTQFLYG